MSRLNHFATLTLKHTDPLVLAIAAAALIAISLLALDYINTPYGGTDNARGLLDTAGSDSAAVAVSGQS